jgi:hypothetical protein
MRTAAIVPPFSFERDEAHRQMMAKRYPKPPPNEWCQLPLRGDSIDRPEELHVREIRNFEALSSKCASVIKR